MAKLDSHQKRALRVSVAGADGPRLILQASGIWLGNKLTVRFGWTRFAFRGSRSMGTVVAMVAPLGHNHRGDSVLEDKLFLVIGFEHHGVFVERANAARQLDSSEQIN